MCRKREEDIAAGNAELASASAAATVQDDFADLGEGDLAELDIKDKPENLVRPPVLLQQCLRLRAKARCNVPGAGEAGQAHCQQQDPGAFGCSCVTSEAGSS